jgi:hypothetical protein
MRTVAFLLMITAGSCGSETPMLGGAPHPSNGAMAGGAAAAAAALTLADPHAADRKPEQRQQPEKQPVDVKEQVPSSAFDHLDGSGTGSATGSGSASGSATATATGPATGSGSGSNSTAKKLPMIPSPHDAVDPSR